MKALLLGDLSPSVYNSHLFEEKRIDILFEDIEKVKERISQLREMGFKIAISEVGDRYCPILTLAQIDFDYAFLDESVVASLVDESGEKVAQSMIGYLKSLEVKTFAPDTADADTDVITVDGVCVGVLTVGDGTVFCVHSEGIVDTVSVYSYGMDGFFRRTA